MQDQNESIVFVNKEGYRMQVNYLKDSEYLICTFCKNNIGPEEAKDFIQELRMMVID